MSYRRTMVDLHCHYLPGVDDGAQSLEHGLELLRAAFNNGIDRIVLTPHVHPGRYDNTLGSLRGRFEAFCRAAASAQIPVSLAIAGEVRLGDEILPLLEAGQIPLLESAYGEKTLLLELPHSHIPVGSAHFVRWLKQRDITAMIAHPERNKEYMAHPERLQELISEGCLVQITAASVIGKFGARAQECARYFLERDWVSILATDAHNLHHRPPLLSEAAERVASWYGDDRADRLVEKMPAMLAAGNFIKAGAMLHRRLPMSVDKVFSPDKLLVDATTNVAIESRQVKAVAADLCDSALAHMRSELQRRTHQAGIDGAKAAQILRLMDANEG